MFLFLLTFIVLMIVGAVAKAPTFTHRLALCVDILFASLLWSSYDVTISARAGISVRNKAAGKPYSRLLILLAYILNKIEANHVELAIQADTIRGVGALMYLQVPEAGSIVLAGRAPVAVTTQSPPAAS